MQIAVYARVSTERQEREQTIESQLYALQVWASDQGHHLEADHIFTDEGYSGARLDRPGLDRLRDAARAGEFEAVAVWSPDRLARKYAYQVLLLEELQRVGCAVIFVHRPISDDPNDQLLLQIQGAIAEYERAVLGERMRRGKLQKARDGRYIGGKAPYGYRYVPKQEGVPGYLVIDETEAELVRTLYRWLVDEHMTIRQILKRLNAGPWRPRSGHPMWSAAVVHRVLSEPLYAGTTYANRYHYEPARKPRKPAGPRSNPNSSRRPRPQEEWIPIAIPAIVDQTTYDQAQAQLARNAALSFRNNTKHSYLLRCLLTCGVCGLAMSGRAHTAAAEPEQRYYECKGKSPLYSARPEVCSRRYVKAAELEALVWEHVVQLLSHPEQLLAQFHEAAHLAQEGDAQEQMEEQKLLARIARLQHEERRLVDAYQAGVIELAELRERREQVAHRRRALVEQHEQQLRLRQERARSQEVLADLTAFCDRIRSRLATVTFAERQAILQLLIERIIVSDDTVEIRHVIRLRSGPEPARSPSTELQLRSDGLPAGPMATGVRQRQPALPGTGGPGVPGKSDAAGPSAAAVATTPPASRPAPADASVDPAVAVPAATGAIGD